MLACPCWWSSALTWRFTLWWAQYRFTWRRAAPCTTRSSTSTWINRYTSDRQICVDATAPSRGYFENCGVGGRYGTNIMDVKETDQLMFSEIYHFNVCLMTQKETLLCSCTFQIFATNALQKLLLCEFACLSLLCLLLSFYSFVSMPCPSCCVGESWKWRMSCRRRRWRLRTECRQPERICVHKTSCINLWLL